MSVYTKDVNDREAIRVTGQVIIEEAQVLVANAVKIQDSGGALIDPATEQKQDETIAAITAEGDQTQAAIAAVTTTEDLASADGQQGFAVMAVRNDTDAPLTDADGDESRITVDEAGRVKTRAALVNDQGDIINPPTLELQQELVALAEAASAPDGTTLVSEFKTEFEYRWFEVNPANVLKINKFTGSASQGNTGIGGAFWRTGTTPGSVIDVESVEGLVYSARHLSLYDGSFFWSVKPTGSGRIQAGPFTDIDGFFFERTAAADNIVYRFNRDPNGAPDNGETRVAFGSQNGDKLDGNADPEAGPVSAYTKNGVPVEVTFEQFQIAQFIGSWRGVDTFEIYIISPDKRPVLVHRFYFVNESTTPSLTNPNLPIRVRLENGDAADDLVLQSNCWSLATNCDKRVQVKTRSNTTTALLAANGSPGDTFVGGRINTRFYPYWRGSVIASHDGRFRFHWSDDGSTDPGKYEVGPWIEYSAGDGRIEIPPQSRKRGFGWIEFENTAVVAQTLFELDIYLDERAPGIPTILAKQNIGGGEPVIPVKVYSDPADPLSVNVTLNDLPVSETNPLPVEAESVTLDNQGPFVDVGASATALVSATADPKWVTITVLPMFAGVPNIYGVHLKFGGTGAPVNTTAYRYYGVGSHTWKTDQAISGIREAAAIANVKVTVEIGVPPA